jgi:predicted lactoylglutathione lyase
MTSIASLTIETADTAAVDAFHAALLRGATTASGADPSALVRSRVTASPSTGFRGFSVSLVVDRPADVDAFLGAAVDAGAGIVTPVAKSFWGYGGVVQAPDGTIWKVATSEKKNTGPATRRIERIVVQLGVADVAVSKAFYTGRGFAVAKAFGRKYVEFEAGGSGPLVLALLSRKAVAKDAGVPVEGSGAHRLVLGTDAGTFTDPDGFEAEAMAGADAAPAASADPRG